MKRQSSEKRKAVKLTFMLAASLFIIMLTSCAESTCPTYTMNEPQVFFRELHKGKNYNVTPSASANAKYSDKYKKRLEKSIKKTNRDNIFVSR